MQTCQHLHCKNLPTVECHERGDESGATLVLLCEEHADLEGYCTFCGERRAERDPITGLCLDCQSEGIAL